jgi:hypothetical protein
MASIPSTVHFIWLGDRFGALPYLAVRAALDRSRAHTVRLHADAPSLADHPLAADLASRGCEIVTLDAAALVDETRPRLAALYRRLEDAPSKTNLLRLLLLWREGGIYLDTDAITLRSLDPLREEAGFAGLERIAFPASLYGSRNPLRWCYAGVLTAARDIVRRLFLDTGSAFRRIERLYPLATNNAVLGAAPRHPAIGDLLDHIGVMDLREATRRYRLGPQLLERVTGNRSRQDFRLFQPSAFYPLPPEICLAYVKPDPGGRLGDRPHPDTFAAHLYDSVLSRRLGRPLDEVFFRETRGTTLLARMVEPYLDDLLANT